MTGEVPLAVIFSSLTFIVFFALVLLMHSLPLRWGAKKFNLLLASYVFYAAWNPPYVTILWAATLVAWFTIKWMASTTSRRGRLLCLLACLVANLGLLGFFKYGGFLLENFVVLARSVGIDYAPPRLDLLLPLGISFFTFKCISYAMDVYQRRCDASPSLLDFALHVGFFPLIAAGPIVRAGQFLPQCREPRRANVHQLGWGLSLLVIGLFQKVVLADGMLTGTASTVFNAWQKAGIVDSWIGAVAFTGQIFFDFAGYSTCAIGAALCLGFAIPDNFRFPYAATSPSDFWHRWHISLSTWLRDYLYIPLGGNRKGSFRSYVNLMVTMLLGGLWHGASWKFVAWGGLHGVYLVVERLLSRRWERVRWPDRLPVRLLGILVTFLLVCVAWVLFRADSLTAAFHLLGSMFGVSGRNPTDLVPGVKAVAVAVIVLGLLATHGCLRNSSLEQAASRLPWWLKAVLLAAMVAAIVRAPGEQHAFIYFQF